MMGEMQIHSLEPCHFTLMHSLRTLVLYKIKLVLEEYEENALFSRSFLESKIQDIIETIYVSVVWMFEQSNHPIRSNGDAQYLLLKNMEGLNEFIYWSFYDLI